MTYKPEFVEKLQCQQCRSTELRINGLELACDGCNAIQRFSPEGILENPALELGHGANPMKEGSADQDVIMTRHRYQSIEYARKYLRRYRNLQGLYGIYDTLLARHEQRCIRRAIDDILPDIQSVLDIPAGTGKLKTVFSSLPVDVVAADISKEMLETGFAGNDGPSNLIGLAQSDICHTNFRDDTFDCVVCLRLMHRVPDDFVLDALTELARISGKYIIVSAAIDRVCVASLIGRKKKSQVPRRSISRWHNLLSSVGDVGKDYLVSSAISSEIVSLVRIDTSMQVVPGVAANTQAAVAAMD